MKLEARNELSKGDTRAQTVSSSPANHMPVQGLESLPPIQLVRHGPCATNQRGRTHGPCGSKQGSQVQQRGNKQRRKAEKRFPLTSAFQISWLFHQLQLGLFLSNLLIMHNYTKGEGIRNTTEYMVEVAMAGLEVDPNIFLEIHFPNAKVPKQCQETEHDPPDASTVHAQQAT
ncbi:uncharacterized protein LOC125211333 isoform X2 [Salvia hispanica]|nr:uncharacterized protein LOC125211333 isoform X2 [Salvia hispanica]